MAQEPLVIELIEAGWEFLQEFNEYKRVDVAFWGQLSEDGRWQLFLASNQFFPNSTHVDYKQVHKIVREGDYFLDPLDVTLIPMDHPAAATAREILETHPVRFGTGVNVGISSFRTHFQSYGIDQAYIYKPIVPVTAV